MKNCWPIIINIIKNAIAPFALLLSEGPISTSYESIHKTILFGQPSPFAIMNKVIYALATLSKLD